MTAPSDARARRYLLGAASEEECAVLEQEYLEHDQAVERIAAAEDDLIEDYLAGQLGPADRDRFERAYLSVPHRRVRVETIRRLMAHASRPESARPGKGRVLAWPRFTRRGSWMALAASILVVASMALWRFASITQPRGEIGQAPASPAAGGPQAPAPAPAAPPAAPRVFALTLSPASVRTASERTRIVIPPGIDTVVIRLERDVDGGALEPRRASIQTVVGDEAWQGPVTADSDPPPGTAARIDVPSASLPPDDYVVILHGTDRAGLEREWTRYFLSIRAR